MQAKETMKTWAFLFDECESPNTKEGKLLYGGKGAALAEMTKLVYPSRPDLSSQPNAVGLTT